jgi:hypothetical protein
MLMKITMSVVDKSLRFRRPSGKYIYPDDGGRGGTNLFGFIVHSLIDVAAIRFVLK